MSVVGRVFGFVNKPLVGYWREQKPKLFKSGIKRKFLF